MWGGVARQLAPPASHVCVVQIRHIAYAFGGVNGTRPGYVVLDYGDPQLFVRDRLRHRVSCHLVCITVKCVSIGEHACCKRSVKYENTA